MDVMFMQLKKLHDNELYPNVLPIVSKSHKYLLSFAGRTIVAIFCCCVFQACIIKSAYNFDRSLLSPEQYFLVLIYNANSLFQQQQYRKADLTYREALSARKGLAKSGSANKYENTIDQYTDCEIKYKSALCLDMEKKSKEAITMLQSIPAKQRTMKVNMLLGKLCERAGRDTNATVALKAVLKETPLNLEAIKILMSLSVPEADINAIIAEGMYNLFFAVLKYLCQFKVNRSRFIIDFHVF